MLGAFYQCYQNPKNFLATLKSFRETFPDASLIIHNDGGENYSYLASKYKASYTYHPRTTNETISNLVFKDKQRAIDYLQRLWDSFSKISEPFLLILEDDVRIFRTLACELPNDLNGCNPHEHLLNELQCELPSGTPTFYGGCGGSILRKEFFQNIPFRAVESILTSLSLPTYPSDQILTFLVRKFGGTVGPYDDFAEEWYPDILERKLTKKVAILHNYKKEYGIPLTDEEEKEIWPYGIRNF